MRAEIEFMRAMALAQQSEGRPFKIEGPASTFIALCDAWLRLDRAPAIELSREDWIDHAESFGADFIGKRVRLVAEENGS